MRYFLSFQMHSVFCGISYNGKVSYKVVERAYWEDLKKNWSCQLRKDGTRKEIVLKNA